jgi:hypothetical protein
LVSSTLICGRALLQVKDHDLSVDDLDIAGNMDGGKWVVAGNHDTLHISFARTLNRLTNSVRRIGKHLEDINGIGFERTVENKETSEIELALDLITVDVVDLSLAKPQNNGSFS